MPDTDNAARTLSAAQIDQFVQDSFVRIDNAGDAGLTLRELIATGFGGTEEKPVALATGDAGTAYLCHPFLFTPLSRTMEHGRRCKPTLSSEATSASGHVWTGSGLSSTHSNGSSGGRGGHVSGPLELRTAQRLPHRGVPSKEDKDMSEPRYPKRKPRRIVLLAKHCSRRSKSSSTR